MEAYNRFLKYVSFPTMSDEASETVPSTEKQLKFGEYLTYELKELGLDDAFMDSNGYVYATLRKNCEKNCPTIGFIAHMDTSPAASDENIRAKIVKYTGEDILLNKDKGIYLRKCDYPYLTDYLGHDLIVTDGTTLLGADDKAGIAEIISAVEYILKNDIPHGDIKIAFTPDEEIGRGADLFDVENFGADYAYTVDGGAMGEIEYENFNAATASVEITGLSIHPGSAKGKMINASHVACEFDALLPIDELPETTEGYEGFHHLVDISGETEKAVLTYIIRDHDEEKFAQKKQDFEKAANILNNKYKEDTVKVTITDSYYNMKKMIEPCMYIVDRAKEAMTKLGITPINVPIRGGTDGARLSYMGLPCPNLCTGGNNFHSRFEFISANDMERITALLAKIMADAVKYEK